jgi:protease-4
VIALLVIAAIYAIWKVGGSPSIAMGSTLVIELSGSYVEAPDTPFFGQLLGVQRRSLLGTLSELRKAERDDRIAHVMLVVRNLRIGWAKAQELRDAIRALRDAGRHPVAYLEV